MVYIPPQPKKISKLTEEVLDVTSKTRSSDMSRGVNGDLANISFRSSAGVDYSRDRWKRLLILGRRKPEERCFGVSSVACH